MSDNRMPPIPYKTPILSPRGPMTEPWLKFFRELWARLGGDADVPSGGSSVITNSENILDLQERVEALEQEPVNG